jgi:hypothetical protein
LFRTKFEVIATIVAMACAELERQQIESDPQRSKMHDETQPADRPNRAKHAGTHRQLFPTHSVMLAEFRDRS